MASQSEIANLALVRIGTDARILTLDDDRTAARTLKAVWDIQRRATLRDGWWNFAIRRKSVPAEVVSAQDIQPWSKSYPLPTECIKLLDVLSAGVGTRYQLEGRSILCDAAAPLAIRYLIDVPQPELFDDLFTEAFACRLAWKCGRKLAGSAFSEGDAEAEYRAAIAAARKHDAQENPPLEQEESDWIRARLGWEDGG